MVRTSSIPKSIIYLFLALLGFSLVATAAIQYPTSYPSSTHYVLTFYQTDTNTTLTSSITTACTTCTFTVADASGFSRPGMVFFPRFDEYGDGEIMRITNINGNTITAIRATYYGLGSLKLSHSSGNTVVFAHAPSYTSGSVKLFQDSPHVGDFAIFGAYFENHILESVDIDVTTPAVHDGASFSYWQHDFLGSSLWPFRDSEKWTRITGYDTTDGLQQDGSFSFQPGETSFTYGYGLPLSFYSYIYDENGAGTLYFGTKLRLDNFTNWTQGATISATNTEPKQKLLELTDEPNITMLSLYAHDLKTSLPIITNNQQLRSLYKGDENNLQLYTNVTSYTSNGNLTLEGLYVPDDMRIYLPFVELPDLKVTTPELVQGYDWLLHPEFTARWYPERARMCDGRFTNKTGFCYFGSQSQPTTLNNIWDSYPRLSEQFTIETWANIAYNTKGYIASEGVNKPSASSDQIWFLRLSSGNLTFTIKFADGTTETVTGAISTGYNYIAAKYDGDTMTLNINGTTHTNTGINKDFVNDYYDREPITNIYFADTYGGYYIGSIEEFAIWQKALSDDEITSRFTASQNQYLQYQTANVNITGTGLYDIPNTWAYLLNNTNTGTFDYDVYQNRLNIIRKQGLKYTITTDFSAYGNTTFEDTTGLSLQIGTPFATGARAFNTNFLDTTTGYFRIGAVTDDAEGNPYGHYGGELRLWNTIAQGTYRNYLRIELYGVLFKPWTSSVQLRPGFKAVNTRWQSLVPQETLTEVYPFDAMVLTNDAWQSNDFLDLKTIGYMFKPLYDGTTLAPTPDEGTTVIANVTTPYKTDVSQISIRKGITARSLLSGGVDANFVNYIYKDVCINCDFINFTVTSRAWDCAQFGNTLKINVYDKQMNPISGAQVYVTDKDGNSVIFTLDASDMRSTQTGHFGGSNYGTIDTTIAMANGSRYTTGDVLDFYGERWNVTNVAGNTITVTRAFENTTACNIWMYAGNWPQYNFIPSRKDYMITDASGAVKELIIYTESYNGTGSFNTKNPITVRIVSGYDEYETTFVLSEKTELDIVLGLNVKHVADVRDFAVEQDFTAFFLIGMIGFTLVAYRLGRKDKRLNT